MVVALGKQRRDAAGYGAQGSQQGLFRLALEEPGIDGGGQFSLRLGEDIGNALVGRRQGRRLRELLEAVHGQCPQVEFPGVVEILGAYRHEHLGGDAFLLEPGAEALQQVAEYLLLQSVPGAEAGVETGGKTQGVPQVEVNALVHQDAQHPEAGPAQGEGIPGAGGRLADPEDAHQGIDAVRQGDGGAGGGGGQAVPGEGRVVLLQHGLCHLVRLAVVAGVVAAHDALQVIELHHHLAHQVRLAQLAGPFYPVGIGAEGRGQVSGEGGDAFGLVEDRAELLLEDDGAQLLAAFRQAVLAVGGVEEGGVRQARANHLLVAGNHPGRVAAVDIGHGDEQGHELAGVVHHMEILLVLPHGGDQRLRRHVEKTGLEAPHQGHRPFIEGGHLVQQAGADDRVAAGLVRRLRHTLADQLAALGKAGDHMGAAQVLGVAGGGLDTHRAAAVEAVAAADLAGDDGQYRIDDHRVAQHQHHPVHRAHKFVPLGTPAHPLGDGQCRQGTVDDARQEPVGSDPVADSPVAELVLAAVIGDVVIEGFHGDAVFPGKGEGGAGGVAVTVKGHLGGRAPVDDLLAGGLFIQILH